MNEIDLARTELLVIRAMNGGDAAMSEIVRVWTPWLRATLSNWLHDSEDIDEVAQSTWFEAWTSLGKLSEPRAFHSWLRQIAFRSASTHLRKTLRPKNLHLSEEPAYVPTLAWLASAFAALSPAQSSVMRMHFAEGYSIEEIANTLQVPSGTVKSRIRLAKAILRRKLQD
ncbi:MAG: RNA polymerase sigma factor [Fimbriimonas sp.]